MLSMESFGEGVTHDLFFKWNMSHLQTARQFFELCLPPDLSGRLDWDNLALAKNDHINGELNEVITDMLFQVSADGATGCLSLLVEHKSEGAMKKQRHTLPFLLRRNEVRVMEDVRHRSGKAYPTVHLVGLYHGSRPYRGPETVAQSMEGPDDLIPGRWREKVQLVDLESLEDEALLACGRLGLFLLMMKHIYDQDFAGTLVRSKPLLQELDAAKGNGDFIEVLFRYLFARSKLESAAELVTFAIESLKEETGVHVKSLAERLREEGKAEGLAQGEAGRRQLATELKESRRCSARALLALGKSQAEAASLSGLDMNEVAVLAKEQDVH